MSDRSDDAPADHGLLDGQHLRVDQLLPRVGVVAGRLALDREDDHVVLLERVDRRVVGRPGQREQLVERRAKIGVEAIAVGVVAARVGARGRPRRLARGGARLRTIW